MAEQVPSLDDMLAEAEIALHRLQTGQAYVEVSIAGAQTTKFTPAKLDNLIAYVAELRAQKAGERIRGAIGFVF
jgi:hypothetical protein